MRARSPNCCSLRLLSVLAQCNNTPTAIDLINSYFFWPEVSHFARLLIDGLIFGGRTPSSILLTHLRMMVEDD